MVLINFGLWFDELNFCFYNTDDFGNLYTLSYLTPQINHFYCMDEI